jgi:lipopolysaccharide export system permease protein
MQTLSRYILFELIKVFFVTLSVLTIVVILVGLVREAQEQGLELMQVVRIIPYVLPDSLRYTVPAAILLAACMVYGRMSSSNEVTALKSLGISPIFVLWPVLIFSFLLSLATVWLNDIAVSWGRAGIRIIVLESIEDIAYGMLRTQRSYASRHVSIVVRGVDGKRLIQPVISLQNDGHAVTMSSEEAELRAEPDKGQLTIICRNGVLDVEGRGRILFLNDTLERSVPLEQGSADAEESHPSLIAMHVIPRKINEMRREIEARRDKLAAKAALQLMTGEFVDITNWEWNTDDNVIHGMKQQLSRLETEPHRRWSNGFSCFCFAMLGAPLAIRLRNADFLTTFFLCFFPILIGYYPLLAFGVDQAKNGVLPPSGVWIGNVIALAVGLWQLRTVIRY